MVRRWQVNPAGSSWLTSHVSAPPSSGVTLRQRISACAKATGSWDLVADIWSSLSMRHCLLPTAYFSRSYGFQDHDLLPDLLRQPGRDALDIADGLGDLGVGKTLREQHGDLGGQRQHL